MRFKCVTTCWAHLEILQSQENRFGGDFLEGKPTPMLARAYALASASQLKILDTIGNLGMSHDDVSAVQEVVSATVPLPKWNHSLFLYVTKQLRHWISK